MGGDGLDAQGLVEMLLDPGEDGDEIRRAMRHGLVHAAGIAWADGSVLIGLAVGENAVRDLNRDHYSQTSQIADSRRI